MVAKSAENGALTGEQGALYVSLDGAHNSSGFLNECQGFSELRGDRDDAQSFPQGEVACEQFCQQGDMAARSTDCAEPLPGPAEGEPIRGFCPQECTDFPRDEASVKQEEFDGDPQSNCSSQAGGARKGSLHKLGAGVQISGPRYFVPDIVYAPSDVDPAEILHIPDESCPSQECLSIRREDVAQFPLRLRSWNVAGSSAKRVKALVANELQADVVALQEYPKQEAGWQLLRGEVYNGLIRQNYYMYRAVAIFYCAKSFHLLDRKETARGIWAHLQHRETSKSFWVGCLHLPNSEPRDENQRLLHQFLSECPRKAERGVVLGDFNTQFKWSVQDEACVPQVINTRWADLRQGMAEHGFQQVVPSAQQACTPTFHSRKPNVASTQIDGCFARGLAGKMEIAEGSRVQVGTDHDRVEVVATLVGKHSKQKARRGGPMRVISVPALVHEIDQQTLEHLANKRCRPASLGEKLSRAQRSGP